MTLRGRHDLVINYLHNIEQVGLQVQTVDVCRSK